MDDDTDRVLGARTASAVDQAMSLRSLDPSWGSEVHAFGGGWLILSGEGLYVNRAVHAGVETGLSPADVDALVSSSQAVGVVPAIEVTPSTHRDTVRQLRARGFARDPSNDVSLLTRPIAGSSIWAPEDVVVRPVRTAADLRIWQETSAIGWGLTSNESRRASDAFAAAVNALDAEHLVVAFDSIDGRPVGSASSAIRAGVSIFGGMSTVPRERRRGVHVALLRHRLHHAAELGCDLAATTARTGGGSERNLQRHGFVPRLTIETFVLLPGADSRQTTAQRRRNNKATLSRRRKRGLRG